MIVKHTIRGSVVEMCLCNCPWVKLALHFEDVKVDVLMFPAPPMPNDLLLSTSSVDGISLGELMMNMYWMKQHEEMQNELIKYIHH